MSKRVALSGLAVVLTLGLVAGFLADVPASEVPAAFAWACQPPNGACVPASATKTSALTVEHKKTNTDPVEPDDGETWNIVAFWNTNTTPCAQYTETASVEVSWDGSDWVLSNKNLTANIVAISVCDASMECNPDEETIHAWGYKLIVAINDPVLTTYNLRQVVYTTTSVDDGYDLDTDTCELGSSVSPTTQSFSQTDSGAFTLVAGRCPFGCSVAGPSVTILYR